MLCKHCGYKNVEGAAFCQKCGTKITELPEQETAEQVVAEKPETEPAAEAVFAEPEFDAPEKKAKKKTKKRVVLITAIVVGVLAVAIAVVLIFFRGWFLKNLGSGDDYLKYVEDEVTEKNVQRVVGAYEDFLEWLDKEHSGATDVTVQLKCSDTVIPLLENALQGETGVATDLDWLNGVTVNMDANMKDKAGKVFLSMLINNQEVANADLIMNMGENAIYLAVPFLYDQYRKDRVVMGVMSEENQELLAILTAPEMKDALPSPEAVGELVRKYSNLIYENLKDAEKTTETLEYDAVQQKVTVLTVKMDFDAVKQAVKDLLDAVAEDEAIKKIVGDIAEHLKANGYITNDDQVYEDFLDLLDDAKDAVNDLDEDDFFEKAWISFYVNDSHEIVGMKYKFDSDIVRRFTVRDGEKFAYVMEADEFKITGSGTEKDNVVNGEYTIEADGKEFFTIKVQDFSRKDGKLNGTVVVTPSATLLRNVVGINTTGSSVVSMLNPALELVFNNKNGSGKMDINLLSGNEFLVGMTVTAKKKDASTVAMPDDSKVIPSYQWENAFRMEKLFEKLIQAGVPKSLLQSVFGFKQISAG